MSQSLCSEDEIIEEEILIIEEYIIEEETEVGGDDYELASVDDDLSVEVDFTGPGGPRRTQARRQSEVSCEYMEMTLAEDEFLSCDDLDDAEERQQTRPSYSQRSREQPPSRRTSDAADSIGVMDTTTDDADVTNSSDDGFDLALPDNTNMENWHMSGITCLDFQQSGMLNFEASYIFELVDTDEEEEMETEQVPNNSEMVIVEDQQLSLNPYRDAMNKVRGGPIGKRRSTGPGKRRSTGPIGKRRSTGPGPKRRSTSRGMSPTRNPEQESGGPPTRIAPARTHSGMRRAARRRSYITSPIQEDQPHTPTDHNVRRKMKRASLKGALPNFAKDPKQQLVMEPMKEEDKEDHDHSTSNHNNTVLSLSKHSKESYVSSDLSSLTFPRRQTSSEDNPVHLEENNDDVLAPPESIIRTKSGTTEISALTPPAPPRVKVTMEETNTTTTPAVPPLQADDDEDDASDEAAPPESIDRTKSGTNTEVSALTPPAPPRVKVPMEETNTTTTPAAVIPLQADDDDDDNDDDDASDEAAPPASIARTKSGNTEVSALTPHPPPLVSRITTEETNKTPAIHLRVLLTGENGKEASEVIPAPLESIARIASSADNSEISALTSNHPTPLQSSRKTEEEAAVTMRTTRSAEDFHSEMSPLLSPPRPLDGKPRVKMEQVIDITTSQRIDDDGHVEYVAPLHSIIPRTKSGNSDMSPLSASGHPTRATAKIEGVDTSRRTNGEASAPLDKSMKSEYVAAPLHSIIPRTKSDSELSPLTASCHPTTRAATKIIMEGVDTSRRTNGEASASLDKSMKSELPLTPPRHPKPSAWAKMGSSSRNQQQHLDPSIPKEAIARTKSGNSDVSPLTASGHPRGNGGFSKEDHSPSRSPLPNRVPTRTIVTASNSNNSMELSPLSASGHPRRANVDVSKLSPVRNHNHYASSSILTKSNNKSRGGFSKDGSGDTDRRLLHGIQEDDISWGAKVELQDKILEIQFPSDFKLHNSQDSFSTLDSESLAADSLMSSTRFEATPQQVFHRSSSDVSPVAPRRPVTSPQNKLSTSERSGHEDSSKGTRKSAKSQDHQSHRRSRRQNRRRSLDLHSVTEDQLQQAAWVDSADTINSSVEIPKNSRRKYMRRDLSISSFNNHSRRNLMNRQQSLSSFANTSRRNLMSRQTSVPSGMNTSRRNLGSRQPSKRLSVDESPIVPRRYVAVDVVDKPDSNIDMSMRSLASQSRASRERRSKISRDQSPMRPSRTHDKVVPPVVNIDSDETLSVGSSKSEELLPKELHDSFPKSMREPSSKNNGEPLPKESPLHDSFPKAPRSRDVSPVRPRRTISSKKIENAVALFGDDDDTDSESPPKDSSPEDDVAPIPNEKDDSQQQPPPPSEAEEKKEHEAPIIIFPDFIPPPPPPLPKKGVPIEQLRARRSFSPRKETLEIEIEGQTEDRLSPLPPSLTDKGVRNLKESRSPTEATANTEDSEYQPSLDMPSPAISSSERSDSGVEKGASISPVPNSPAVLSRVSEGSQSLGILDMETMPPSPAFGDGSHLHSSGETIGSLVSASSVRKRRQARATLEKLNSKMSSTFGVSSTSAVGVESSSGVVAAEAAPAPSSAPSTRRLSLEEKRIEARAARERLRQRFTNARARVQAQLPM